MSGDTALSEHFPRLVDPASLPRRALCLAPHPDDEVLGCGGLLALLAAQGAELRTLVLTDGAAGGAAGAVPAQRAEESRRAARELGVSEVRFLGLPDGGLGSSFDLVGRLSAELEAFDPDLVLCPSPFEAHPDHRAASRAASAALARGRERLVLLYGVNTPVPAGVLIDTTGARAAKAAAVACFASQRGDLAALAEARDRAATLDVDVPEVELAEAFVELASPRLVDYQREAEAVIERGRAPSSGSGQEPADDLAATAVITTWNKLADLRENLDALRAQTRPFAAIVVVDNASTDGTAEVVGERYPEVRLIAMPHSAYGACETFNIGFASAATPLVAILDDDVVLPPEWLERTCARLAREPATTAVVSTEVIEPGMPEAYRRRVESAGERYMSTFRGCASLARRAALLAAGGYDERLYIYGNERDLTCRLLNLGYRVLHHPEVRVFHKTPFGIKLGKRSLYYHARNAWLTMLKHAPLGDLARLPWLVLTRVVLRGRSREESGEVADATGTIGIGRSIRATKGAAWVLARAALSVLLNVPYCLKRRAPVRHPDFELPLR